MGAASSPFLLVIAKNHLAALRGGDRWTNDRHCSMTLSGDVPRRARYASQGKRQARNIALTCTATLSRQWPAVLGKVMQRAKPRNASCGFDLLPPDEPAKVAGQRCRPWRAQRADRTRVGQILTRPGRTQHRQAFVALDWRALLTHFRGRTTGRQPWRAAFEQKRGNARRAAVPVVGARQDREQAGDGRERDKVPSCCISAMISAPTRSSRSTRSSLGIATSRTKRRMRAIRSSKWA
jgi:hypothetical protein